MTTMGQKEMTKRMKLLFTLTTITVLRCSLLMATDKQTADAQGGNPINPGIGLTDPHVVIYGDRAYIYATHDFSPDTKGFLMKDWWVWSSGDLVNWQQEGTLRPEDTFLKRPFTQCWATFGASKHGKYYWYFSAGPTEIGVVVADAPAGPWQDPLGRPPVAKGLTPTEQRDPDILMDDDGQAYLEFQVDEAVRKYDLWHDRHGNFFTWHHQWYYACNDKSQPGRSSHYRDTCLSYVHYRDNGELAPIRLDRTGVGQYNAAQSRIEAEDYFDAEQAEIKECPAGGFEVCGLGEGSRLVYPNVKNLPPNATLSFRVASGHPGGATIEVREADLKGRLLGTGTVPSTGGWGRYQTVSCALENEFGTKHLCLTFKGGAGELMRLDWLRVSSALTK